ncbi:MAG: glycosyltransferase family 87 protein [Oligoflexia bacterium]|nr:glycosyltransferase family 87 protein [Oligoflexia bacterium]
MPKDEVSAARRDPWRILFWLLAAARFLSCVPFIVDDDEAWWVVAARALRSPFEYYLRAVDHKPPGIVWFYWFADKLLFFTHVFSRDPVDPRIMRAAFSLCLIAGAFLLGRLAVFFSKRSDLRWVAASFFLIASVVATPKLMTITADGLMILFVIAAYAVAFTSRRAGKTIIAGALLGCALLVKQTGVFFALPILIAGWPKRWSVREIAGFALGASLVYVPAALSLHPSEFFYWNVSYPREVLTRARKTAGFDADMAMLSSTISVLAALFPLVLFAFRARLAAFVKDFRVWWLLSALAGTFLGRGLFLHYFLLPTPPLALLAADGWMNFREAGGLNRFLRTGGMAWLVGGYAFAAFVVGLPFSGLFWGNDLAYYQAVGEKTRSLASLPSGGLEPVLIWGGTTLPLTYAGTTYSGRFLIPRFAEPPYDTPYTQGIFHRDLDERFPRIIVDLHERGDNQFNNPLSTDPFIAERVRHYRIFLAPAIPWVKFYLSPEIPAETLARTALVEVPGGLDGASAQKVYEAYPRARHEWDRFKSVASLPAALALDREMREQDSRNLIDQQGSSGSELVFPERSFLWWAQSAIVELQPKFYKLVP